MVEPEVESVRQAGRLVVLELPRWREAYGVAAGITLLGNPPVADFGLAGAAPVGEVLGRWRTLLELSSGFESLVVSRQVHGVRVAWHQAGLGLRLHDGLDGHGTSIPGVLLAITAADCVPIYLVDPVGSRVALLHAGWRGTAAGILEAGVARMVAEGSVVENIVMHCGVAICGDCYEVGSEVMIACGVPPGGPESPRHLDLRRVLGAQAARLGLGRVSSSGFCSAHDRGLFHSHRASAARAGRMAAYLGIPLSRY